MSLRGALLTLGVVAAFLAIFVPLAMRVNGGRDRTIDGDRLRRTYVALALYETEHDGLPAPNLGAIRQDLEPVDLQSVADPQVGGAGPFPLDPFQKRLALRTPTRVSWSYRWHWTEAGKPKRVDDPRQGVLADPWLDLRITEDGARVEMPKGSDFKSLFGR